MKNTVQQFVNRLASDARIGLAVSAAAMSVVCLFVPYGYPWPSLAWATLASATAAWVAASPTEAPRAISDVISDVEAERPRAIHAARRGVGPGAGS